MHPDDQVTDDLAEDRDDLRTQLGRRGRPGTPEQAAGSTQLGRRAGATQDPVDTETRPGARRDPGSPAVDGNRTQLGRRHPGAQAAPTPAEAPADDEVIRFGPGVPPPATSPQWSSPRTAGRRRRRSGWIGALVTLALAAGVLAYLLTRGTDPVQAHVQSVTATSVPGACDTVVDVVGTIATNGRPGSITYQWLRNDGQPTSVLTQDVPGGPTSSQVHMQWSFSGHGRFDARATLRVLDPAPASEAVGTFTYSCS